MASCQAWRARVCCHFVHPPVAACKAANQGARSVAWSFHVSDERRRVAALQAQPGGPGPFFGHATLSVAYVERLHFAPSALPGRKMASGRRANEVATDPGGVTASWFANRCRPHSPSHCLLHRTDMQVVPHNVAFIVGTQTLRGKQPLPLQRTRSVRVFTTQCVGQAGITLVERILLGPGSLHSCSALAQRFKQRCWQQRGAILISLTVVAPN